MSAQAYCYRILVPDLGNAPVLVWDRQSNLAGWIVQNNSPYPIRICLGGTVNPGDLLDDTNSFILYPGTNISDTFQGQLYTGSVLACNTVVSGLQITYLDCINTFLK